METVQTKIETQVVLLKAARKCYEIAAAALKAKQEELDATLAPMLEAKKQAQDTITTIEQNVRELALEAFAADPSNKKPGPGVGIRVVKRYDYEPTTALAWAKEHGLCLALDSKKFTEICKTDARPEFVTELEELTATIATDLGAVGGE